MKNIIKSENGTTSDTSGTAGTTDTTEPRTTSGFLDGHVFKNKNFQLIIDTISSYISEIADEEIIITNDEFKVIYANEKLVEQKSNLKDYFGGRIPENGEIIKINTVSGKKEIEFEIKKNDCGKSGYMVLIRDFSARRKTEILKESFCAFLKHCIKPSVLSQKRALEFMIEFGNTEELLPDLLKANNQLIMLAEHLLVEFGNASTFVPNFKSCETGKIVKNSVKEIKDFVDDRNQTLVVNAQKFNIVCDEKYLKDAIVSVLHQISSRSQNNTEIFLTVKRHANYAQITISGEMHCPEQQILEEMYFIKHNYDIIAANSGLLAARRIIELHGGSICVETTPTGGTVFDLIVPQLKEFPSSAKD